MARRRFFALPLACMAVLAALAIFSPLRSYDHPIVTAYEATYHLTIPDLTIPEPTAFIVPAERAIARSSPDAHRIAYTVANQPGAAWRIAADMTHRHIDPHIVVS